MHSYSQNLGWQKYLQLQKLFPTKLKIDNSWNVRWFPTKSKCTSNAWKNKILFLPGSRVWFDGVECIKEYNLFELQKCSFFPTVEIESFLFPYNLECCNIQNYFCLVNFCTRFMMGETLLYLRGSRWDRAEKIVLHFIWNGKRMMFSLCFFLQHSIFSHRSKSWCGIILQCCSRNEMIRKIMAY